ncbi:arginine--tRNA ligase [Xanthovirga aplysinae]|uniref:arginine--tRNA ligase n=1 Tax=Xanthovirga aplysinae TaxID=2529853 RepID=UPI0012BCFF30|nr:arginine--tRNA ligase [Xanthovirga aplysinae]MTI33080.1 arginine--tRNA ligase [Xanthovirga aplysinae]
MLLEKQLTEKVKDGFKEIFGGELQDNQIQFQKTRKEFEGDCTLVVFPFVKQAKKSPQQTAELVGQYLQEHMPEITAFNVVKGFLNLVIGDKVWLKQFKTLYRDEHFGFFPAKDQKVMVEYSSPNTNKPLHLGHLRNNFLGFSVANILKAYGYDVVKVNLVNDRGVHICKSMLAYQKFGQEETPKSSGIKGDHLIGKYYVRFDQEYKKEVKALVAEGKTEEEAKKQAPLMVETQEMLKNWEKGDPETVALWEKMNGWVYEGFDETYRTMGVDFDKIYKESETYLLGKDMVEEGLQKEVFYKKEDGSVWGDLVSEGLDNKLVLRADGTSVYMTQDMGTADLKYKDYGCEKSIYVVGNEQDYHFSVLFKLLKRLGRPYAEGMYHLSYGMVDLPTGKMKSREGTVVDADDLMKEMFKTAELHTKELGKIEGFSQEEAQKLYKTLGLGALKYFLLKVEPKKRMLFDPKESIEFQGHTGPFIQYTHARISAILRKAHQLGYDPREESLEKIEHLHASEKSVVRLLNDFPEKIKEAAEGYSPSVIANYAYDLAKEYNSFYAAVSIFNEENKDALRFRIAFSEAVAKTLRKTMGLLGIDLPERM